MLTNVIFSGNSGGGVLNYDGSPTLTNVTFSGNSGVGSPRHDDGSAEGGK